MLVAAAAMAFFACQKQEVNAPEMVKVEGLSFSAEKPEFADASKTEWTGETIQWSEGDKIRVAYTAGGVWQNGDGTATADEENGKKTAKIYASNSVEAGETASFSVPGNFTIPKGVDLEFYGVYPSTAASDASMPYAPSVTVTIPAEQKPLANSFDSKGDLMAAKSVSTYILSEENPLPEAIPLMWTRLVAHGHFTITNLAVVGEEDIKSIALTANAEADMVGQHYLYLDTYNVAKSSGNSVPNKLTIDATNLSIVDGDVSFWACFLSCTWTSVTVQVETDKATYTREIDLSENQKTFAKNARNTLRINMASAERVEEVVSIGSLPFVRDFSEMTGTSELTELEGFSELSKVYKNTSSIRLATSDAAGLLVTNPLNLSQNFHVVVTARGWDDDELQMTVSAGEQKHNVDLTTCGSDGEFVDYVMNFNPVGESATVSFSAVKNKRYYIQKIQVVEGHADLPSTLTVTAPEQMPAEGGEGSFTYTLSNPKDGIELTVSEEADWITDVVVAEGTVTYTVEANNTADPREADITLTYGDLRETVTVSQKGQTATGTTEWVAKSFTDLKDGDEVVIVATKESTSWAMANDKGTGSAPTGVTGITYSNNKLTDAPAEKIIWYIGVDGNNRIFYKDSGKDTWLYCTGTNNGVRVGTNAAKTFTFDSGYLKHVGTGRYVGVYTTNPDWRCYTSTTTNIADQTFLFFVKSGEEEPKPAITVSSEASVNVEATGGTGTVSYTLTNAVADAKVSAQANQTWVTIGTITSTSVPFTVSENTGEQRTATITLSYDGAESKTVNITQAAAQSGGGAEETVIYETAFDYAISGSAYNSATEIEGKDASGTSWGIVYGNWNGSNCAQMRVYTAAKFGSVYMKFDVARATRVTYKAKVSNAALKLNTYYSIDGGSTWTKVDASKAISTTTLTEYNFVVSQTGEFSKVRIKFEATGTAPTSSNYQLTIDDVTIYGIAGEGGTVEPDPEEPSTGVSKTAEITFGNNGVKINAASVTGTDSENNNWTITTVGTTSYTSSSSYYQVGSSSNPATSITFTTTLPAGASVSNVEAKFGGFSNTAGNVTLKVGDTSVGTGKLNASSDVIVKSNSTASGNKVTVTVTDIAKGVKCYYISVNYTD